MAVGEISSEAVVGGAQTLSLSQFFNVTTAGANPQYLVVNALDRNEYTVTANHDAGSFSGNGATLDLASIGSDGRGAGIVFTWQASSGQYVNATYGTLSQLTFTASDSASDVTNISLFGTNSAAVAQQNASNAYALMQADPAGYIGSATVTTQPNFSGTVPTQATPDGIAAIAASFVGDAWNCDGCWVLASTIAAEAGAGLPIESTAIGIAGRANGEWAVVYNGPAASNSNWQSMVTTGDIVCIGTPGGGGHITTCVSGSGSTAMLVDNITYENARGQITNSANDGSASDIIMAPPHPASQEWSGVAANLVVIYALDTPDITDKITTDALNIGTSVLLSTLFNESDPTGRAVREYQAYNTNSADNILLGKVVEDANSASSAVSATSLALLSLEAGAGVTTDTLEVRAYNGSYWGDWQSLAVNVIVQAPVLAAQTPGQTWTQGQHVDFVLPSTVFTDPQHQALSYTASGAGQSGLPSWLSFNPATRAFTGTVPGGLEQFSVAVTATDTVGLSTSETFAVNVPAAALAVAMHTATQTWAEGSAVSFALPSGTFTDPQGESLTYKATQANGAALPNWLQFNSATLTFSGTAPSGAAVLGLKVTATDTSNLSVYEVFSASIAHEAAGFVLGDWQGAGAQLDTGLSVSDLGSAHLGDFLFGNGMLPVLPMVYHHA